MKHKLPQKIHHQPPPNAPPLPGAPMFRQPPPNNFIAHPLQNLPAPLTHPIPPPIHHQGPPIGGPQQPAPHSIFVGPPPPGHHPFPPQHMNHPSQSRQHPIHSHSRQDESRRVGHDHYSFDGGERHRDSYDHRRREDGDFKGDYRRPNHHGDDRRDYNDSRGRDRYLPDHDRRIGGDRGPGARGDYRRHNQPQDDVDVLPY